MLTWVHTGGERGTPAGEIRDWDLRMHMSSVAILAISTIDLKDTEEEMDKDQNLSLEEFKVLEGDHDHLLEGETNTNPKGKGKN